MIATIRQGLAAALDSSLVDELLAAHQEAKRNYYLGGLRLSAVEGGRFCEAAFRLLQQRTSKTFDRLGVQLDTEKLIKQLGNIPAAQELDAVRLHIPRALRVVYDIRNKRNNAHLADGIDPNLQDATLVIGVIDWVLAEFVRLYHAVPANDARQMVENIVTRSAPAIQDFEGFQKVLRTDLSASNFVVLLLYAKGSAGASIEQVEGWVRPKMRANLLRTLHQLEHEKAFIHRREGMLFITHSGQKHVEANRLMAPEPA
ncbi:MAG: hypothetical protein AAB074_21130 [Planctomycetota bacterium]|mgnify:CR=1 FL=1